MPEGTITKSSPSSELGAGAGAGGRLWGEGRRGTGLAPRGGLGFRFVLAAAGSAPADVGEVDAK